MSLPRIYKAGVLPPLRMTAADLAALRQHAQEQGETVSEFCRRALKAQIDRDTLTRRLQEARNAFADGVFADLDARHPKAKE